MIFLSGEEVELSVGLFLGGFAGPRFEAYFAADEVDLILPEWLEGYLLGSKSACWKMARWSGRWTLWKSYMLSCRTKEEKRLWR